MGLALTRILPSGLAFVLLLPSLTAAPRLSNTTVGPVSVAPGAAGPVQEVEAHNAGDGSLNLSVSASVSWVAAPQEGTELPLVRQLGGATVFVNDRTVPLYFNSYGQTNFQIPYETPPGIALLRVDRDGERGNTVSVSVVARSARILRLGIGDYGIIVNQDGSFPIPAATAAQFGINGHPARVGDVLVMFTIGIGQTRPTVATGEPAPREEPLARIVPAPKVFFGGGPISPGVPADPVYVGLTLFFVALYQVNVPIPQGTPPGDEIGLQLPGSGVVSNQVRIAIQ